MHEKKPNFSSQTATMRRIRFFGLAVGLFATLPIDAQTFSEEDIRVQFLKDWERARAYTIDYLNTMPPDKYSFRATDSVRSFAQQMLHLAQSNVNILAFLASEPNIMGDRILEQTATAQTRDSVRYYLIASYDFAINCLKKMKMTDLNERIKLYNWEETKFAWLLKAFEHQTHHRGQTTIYSRLAGFHPPQERLF